MPSRPPPLKRASLLAAAAGAVLLTAAAAQPAAAATFTVTNTRDSGAGSLRQAITDANALAGTDTIDVRAEGTITLASELPALGSDMSVLGPGSEALTIRRGGVSDYRIFTVPSGANVTIRGLTAMGGSVSGSFVEGGGVHNQGTLTLDHVVLDENRAVATSRADGGAIYNAGTLALTDSAVSNSEASVTSAATVGGVTARGGGIFNVDNVGVVTLTRTTVHGNHARVTAPNGAAPDLNVFVAGGGVYNDNSLTATNVTVSGNSATAVLAGPPARGSGGGIASSASGHSLALHSVTLAFNAAPFGANLFTGVGSVTVRNTIVANPEVGANCVLSGGLTSEGHNLDSGATCDFGEPTDQPSVDPQLEPLADNGGPTQTHALPESSPAVDSGIATGLATDQRGLERPFDIPGVPNGADGAVDIGAFERQELAIAVDDTGTVGEDSGETTFDVLSNDSDPLGRAIEITAVSDPAHGAARVVQEAPDRIAYTPDAEYCNDPPAAEETLTYTITGGATAVISLLVTCVNDPPTAADDAVTMTEDSGARTIDVLANDSDKEGDPIEITAVSDPSHGIAQVVQGTPDRITYTPDRDYCNTPPGDRPGTLRYTINGGATGSVMVTVECVDDPPAPVDPGPPAPPAPPATVTKVRVSPRVRVSRKLVPVRLACAAPAGSRCSGILELRPSGRGARTLRKRFSIKAGAKATVRFRPTAAMRAQLARKGKLVVRATTRLDGKPAVVKRLTILRERR
jgi:hypothetical protein